MASRQYKVYFTPRIGETTYGTEVEVSAQILGRGIKTMKKTIDAGDFDVGVYTYGDISLKVFSKNGKFNDETDGRSIFVYSRDLCKVRITYVDAANETTRFNGLINEEATKEDFEKEEVTFKVLSLDSVLRTTRVAGGLIANGVTATSAFSSLLNTARITSVLNYSLANINPDQNITIDVGSAFDNQKTTTAINDLLLATNSVLVIDSSNNMIVKSRDNDPTANVTSLYGPYDEKMRQNILSAKKYNKGLHRTFTSAKVNTTVVTDLPFATDYGYRQKSVSFDFITDAETESDIATAIVNEFKTPKIEIEVEVETSFAKTLDLLDTVSLNYPLRIKRYENSFLPVVGDTKIGDTAAPLPYTFGSNFIRPNVAFKIIEISENPSKFSTTLKLRQTQDGYLSAAASCFVGFAVIGESAICGTGDTCAKFNPAYIGAAKVGCTNIA